MFRYSGLSVVGELHEKALFSITVFTYLGELIKNINSLE